MSTTTNSTRTASAAITAAIIFLFILWSGHPIRAQEVQSPERGFRPAGSYAIGDIETISMSNGNLMLHLPLASLPAGRGEAGGGFALMYNAKIWDSWQDQFHGFYGNGEPGVWTLNMLQASYGGGWKYTFGYTLATISRRDQFSDEDAPKCPYPEAVYTLKFKVVFPDGSEHFFRPIGFSESPYLNDGYFQISPTGGGFTCSGVGNGSWPAYTTFTTNKMVYYSTDGSYLRLEIEHDSDTDFTNNPWTLYFPDGRRVTGGNTPQRIYDRNNNYVEIQNITYNSHPATKLIDQLNRSVVVEYDSGANQDYIYSTGANNTQLMTTVKWTTVAVSRQYLTTDDTTAPVGAQGANASFRVVDQVILPEQSGGLAYSFGYNGGNSNGWGEVSSVTLPSGAQTSYQYAQDGQSGILYSFVLNNAPSRKDLTYLREYDGSSSSVTETSTYSFDPYGNPGGTVTGPDGGVYTEAFNGVGGAPPSAQERWDYGLSLVTVKPDGLKTERLWQPNRPYGAAHDHNPYLKTEFTSIKDAAGNYSKTAIKDYQIDKNGNVTSVTEYDWIEYASVPRDSNGRPTGIPSGAPAKKITSTAYYNATPDASDISTDSSNVYHKTGSPNLHSAPSSSEVSDGSQVLSRTEFFYDDASTYGNLTEQKSWDSTKGAYSNPLSSSNSISVSSQYSTWSNGNTGKLTQKTDARGTVTVLTYGLIGGYDIYPTQFVTASGTSVASTQTRTYDFGTGLVTSVNDTDNNVTTSTTYDVFGRATLVKNADGNSEETHIATEYSDTNRRVIVRADLNSAGDGKLVTIQHYDQLGRIRLARQLEDASTQSATDETTGIKVQTRYAFSGSNSYVLTSNPYRANYSSNAGSESTMGWTRSKSDNGRRVIEMQTFGGGDLPAPWGSNTTTTGTATTAYDAIFTTSTDQAGKVRRSMADGLGRVVRVDEPDGNGSLGTTASPNQATSYSYDAMGNLINVYQGSQTRTFAYSSLSRLTSAQNPESGTISYAYDNGGNLTIKTDARSISTTYAYDALSRVTSRSYSDGTPTVTYTYDPNITNGKGRLASVSSSVSSYSYGSYDALGRVLTATQTIGSQSYTMSYAYNRAGLVTSMTYPSGHTVSNSFDAAGRLSSVSGYLGDNTLRTYSTGIAYAAGGQMVQEQFGTTTPIYNKLFYNSRGQLSEIREGVTGGDTNWERGAIINHYSGNCWGMCSGSSMPDNNGNLQKQDVYIPGVSSPFSQFYGYDSLNRLQSVREDNVNGQANWKQSYIYDRYGNRTVDQNSSNTYGDGIPKPNFDLETGTNRLLGPGDLGLAESSRSMRFDAAGNLWKDTYSGAAVTRLYDAENKMTKETQASNYVAGEYSYDGDGHRVKRKVGDVETWQVYGIGGELLTEYAANASRYSPQKEYGYRNGQMLIEAEVPAGAGGTAPTFTDDPLNPGGTQTEIKLVHLTQLRTEVNNLRARVGLSAASFAQDPNPTQYVTEVHHDHIMQLRQALEPALTALHLPTVPVGGYAHGDRRTGDPIYATDFQELRDEIKAAFACKIHWLVADQLGTPRMIFDQSGSLTITDQHGNYVSGVTRHDYLPFGEELFAGTGGRSTSHGYSASDSVRQHFTQKERDNETGLDYFGARYYSNTQGRFTSSDEPFIDQAARDPQSWNLYGYVRNNPLGSTDPNGRVKCDSPLCQRIANFMNGFGWRTNAEVKELINKWRSWLYARQAEYGALVNCVNGNCTVVNIAELDNYGVLRYAAKLREARENNQLRYYSEDEIDEMTARTVPLAGLTRIVQNSVDKINRTISDHLSERDIQGLTRDVSKNPVPKPSGGDWDHYKETTEAVQGLKNNIRKLERALENPNLDPQAKIQVEQAIQKAQNYVTRVEKIIRSH